MEILTAAEMRETDRRTAEEFGVGLDALMEQAGRAVGEFCARMYPAAERVGVLCGKGNNGGDGFVAARVLAGAGRQVSVVLLGRMREVQGEAAAALGRLRDEAPAVRVDEAGDEARVRELWDGLEECGLLVDAVVGTGFKPPLKGLAVVVRDLVAAAKMPVVAVDLPSGWDADSMKECIEGAFRADAVVTFTAPKTAHLFGHMTCGGEVGEAFGPVVVAGIGSPEEAVKGASGLRWTGSSKRVAERPRPMNSNKGMYGHVLVVGGSYGKAGAAAMASLAALRTGAGLVTAAVPKGIADLVAMAAPELMLAPLSEGEEGAISFKNLEGAKLDNQLKKISVLAVGPGLSTMGDAPEFARQLVEKTTLPIVLDADALNAFDGKQRLLDGEGRVMVLTPHPGEMARLAGLTVKQVEADRVGLARKFATQHKLTLVLKGWRTLVAHPDGRVAVNTSGHPAMAKGGSGDILTGMVAAMLAQYAESGEAEDVAAAVEAAVFLHGLAGGLAAREMDEHTVLATDTLAHLTNAFRYRVMDAAGLTWICGLNTDMRAL